MRANIQSRRIINRGIPVFIFCLCMCLLTGCATLDMRFTNYPDEVESTFPSTRRVYKMLDCYFSVDPPNLKPGSSIFIMESIYIYYPLVEFPTALVTDVLLWPLDYYFAPRKEKR
jgi:hypothetical protein